MKAVQSIPRPMNTPLIRDVSAYQNFRLTKVTPEAQALIGDVVKKAASHIARRMPRVIRCLECYLQIPYIGMRIVRRIKAFHALLRRHGIEAPALVFAMPNTHGTFSVDHKKYNKAIDRFLDYIQTPLNSSGERYYIRQHQLRRLFALLFYLMPFYGGLDDLRWMLRHIDPRHLEHYITNAFPGSQLVSIRSEVLAIILRENENVLVDLRTFVKAQFDTTQIDLMTNEGFEQYIHFLKRKQSDGSLQVRPVYFDTPDGTRHTFAVTVFEVEDEV